MKANETMALILENQQFIMQGLVFLLDDNFSGRKDMRHELQKRERMIGELLKS